MRRNCTTWGGRSICGHNDAGDNFFESIKNEKSTSSKSSLAWKEISHVTCAGEKTKKNQKGLTAARITLQAENIDCCNPKRGYLTGYKGVCCRQVGVNE